MTSGAAVEEVTKSAVGAANTKVSAPAPPVKLSRPTAPVIWSLPSPPLMVSFNVPPAMVSLPAPPVTEAATEEAPMESLLAVPVIDVAPVALPNVKPAEPVIPEADMVVAETAPVVKLFPPVKFTTEAPPVSAVTAIAPNV